MERPRWNIAAILEAYELLVYGDINYITDSLKQKCAKSSDTLACTCILTFRGPFIVIYSYNKTNEMH